ncbi:MAG TPA: HD domain-containing protein [Anaerolineae bacterium]|nr:HD domain-containing protein [Anaerolineae bacterium]
MKNLYIESVTANIQFEDEPFILHDVVQRLTRDDRPYLLCTLRDRTGQINAVYWNAPEDVCNWVAAGQIILATGRTATYKDELQITLTNIEIWSNPDLGELLPASDRPRSEMVAELQQKIDSLAEPWQGLLTHLLLQPPYHQRFINAPAARSMHHAFVSGLLEHSLSMATIADQLAQHYPHVNRDLLIAGALIHDMGKMIEFEDQASFVYSDDGRLIGHIVRAIVLVETAAQQLGTISTNDLRQLTHLIASHHGQHEWGAPVVPKTIEAILLHQIDMIDSRVQGFYDHWQQEQNDNLWSNKRSFMHNTELRRPPTWPVSNNN